MEAQYARAMRKVAEMVVREALPEFRLYASTKEERAVFLAGSVFFRQEVSKDAYCYLVLSPGKGKESYYVVLVGWGFGASLREHNYLEQLRELGGRIRPTRRFDSGFVQLEALEDKAVIKGEELPQPQGTLDPREAEEVVSDSLRSALDRVVNVLPEFVKAIVGQGAVEPLRRTPQQ